MKKTVTIIVILTLLFSLFSCSTNPNQSAGGNSGNNSTSTTKPAKDKLTFEEFCVYDILTHYLSDFNDPSSVKIVDIHKRSNEYAIVSISAKNSYGGTVTNDFIVFINSYKLSSGKLVALSGTMYEYNSFHASKTQSDSSDRLVKSDLTEFMKYFYETSSSNIYTYNIGNMNAALTEYMVEQGWSK